MAKARRKKKGSCVTSKIPSTVFKTANEAIKLATNDTDRGFIVAIGAYCDECLELLLRTHLRRMSRQDDLIDGLLNGAAKGPISTFSARTKTAVALGLLAPEWLKPVLALGRIRNQFAHKSDTSHILPRHVDVVMDAMPDVGKADLKQRLKECEEMPAKGLSAARLQFATLAVIVTMDVYRAISRNKRRLTIIAKALYPYPSLALPLAER